MNNEIDPDEIEYRDLICFLRENATALGIVTNKNVTVGQCKGLRAK